MSKFKVGDKVRVKERYAELDFLWKGDMVVVEVAESNVIFYVNHPVKGVGVFDEFYFELCEPEEQYYLLRQGCYHHVVDTLTFPSVEKALEYMNQERKNDFVFPNEKYQIVKLVRDVIYENKPKWS